ncbi:ferredoxin--nitrite reductase [Trichocoleus sp. FACHB-262]|uniref:ferredoxin--nitrite reductase n=1 Tax=Trichocoleus sp. FACHB-262 TaxID=2692869 RepID=UPI001686A0AA|nr:ferredoxin--nitrite reductase [Trichocoleus sp. FACHB-262]
MTTAATNPATGSNKFEKLKAEKDGLEVKKELDRFAQIGWEAMDETDRDYRLKWLGVFFRPVTPGKFMLRMRIPNGILTSGQVRVLGEVLQRYGEDGTGDITTRQNIQLRGIRIEDLPDIFRRFEEAGLTSIQSGMDNVRNITGSPVAGIDADELIDTRGIVRKVQDMITNNGEGNPSFTNLPRKFNIAIAGCRDNSVHAEINDIAFVPAYKNNNLGFNVLVGGFFSAKRCEAAIPMNVWVDPRDVVALCEAILLVYRNHGLRANRQKARLMWLIDEWGLDKFRSEVEQQMGHALQTAAPKDEIVWDKRDHVGIHAQKQPGLNYVGLHVPVGRLYAQDMFDLARLAEVYGSGEVRLSVEQNVIVPNIPDSRLGPFLKEPLLQRFTADPAPLSRSLVSCTGSQFCNFALIETKNRAAALIQELDSELSLPKSVRIHWTGCPNSCGQPQVADIGLMGTKVRKDGKTVEGVDLYMGGKVGKHAVLGTCVQKSIPCEDLKPFLTNLLIQNFGAQIRTTPLKTSAQIQFSVEEEVVPSPVAAVNVPAASSYQPVAVATPVPSAPPAPPAQPAIASFAKSGKEVACTEADTLLDVATQAGVELDSSCQAGTCGTCKQKLLEGQVRYEGEPDALDASEQAAGWILTCIAHPIGKVVIDA